MRTRIRPNPLFPNHFRAGPRHRCWPGLALGLGLALSIQADDPTITRQPTNQSVSLGGAVDLVVVATTTNPPISRQWQHASTNAPITFTNLPGATNYLLRLNNVTADAGGFYQVIVCNGLGNCVTSQVAELNVDPTFIKVTGQPIVEDAEPSQNGTWCDYDRDGYLDLFVSNSSLNYATKNSLYHNEQNGLFTRVTNALTTRAASSSAGVWGDYNNDGRPDLFVTHPKFFQGYVADELYHNDGGGAFTRMVTPWITNRNRAENFPDVSWIDLDADGWIDLFATAWYHNGTWSGLPDVAFRNLGDGNFKALTSTEVGSLLTDSIISFSACFADFDDDGDTDAYVPWYWATGQNRLHRNTGSGIFESVQLGSLPEGVQTITSSWVDYDNDGDFDLFATHFGAPASLHRNTGAAGFENATDQAGLVTPIGEAFGPAWGDFDNDGDLDLFIAHYVTTNLNQLFLNNGDGTFTLTDVGSPTHDRNIKQEAPRWIDYDNDGFLDLFVACGETDPAKNLLYHNNLQAGGNANKWLKVKLNGVAANRDGIGAKIRVTATIGGREVRQLRQITSNEWSSGSELLAHFGLGDATKVDTLRIEWPSGIVQELKDVAVDQQPYLTVVESQNVAGPERPQVTAQSRDAAGVFHATVAYPTANLRCVLEASTDLVQWTKVQVRTNAPPAAMEFIDVHATNQPVRFYRVVVP
jgi:hypothetical protein